MRSKVFKKLPTLFVVFALFAEASFLPSLSHSEILHEPFDIAKQTVSYVNANYGTQNPEKNKHRMLSTTQKVTQAPHIDLEIAPPIVPVNAESSKREFSDRDKSSVLSETSKFLN